jgi:hypothetical protein
MSAGKSMPLFDWFKTQPVNFTNVQLTFIENIEVAEHWFTQ